MQIKALIPTKHGHVELEFRKLDPNSDTDFDPSTDGADDRARYATLEGKAHFFAPTCKVISRKRPLNRIFQALNLMPGAKEEMEVELPVMQCKNSTYVTKGKSADNHSTIIQDWQRLMTKSGGRKICEILSEYEVELTQDSLVETSIKLE